MLTLENLSWNKNAGLCLNKKVAPIKTVRGFSTYKSSYANSIK